jgi:hypothetical protein
LSCAPAQTAFSSIAIRRLLSTPSPPPPPPPLTLWRVDVPLIHMILPVHQRAEGGRRRQHLAPLHQQVLGGSQPGVCVGGGGKRVRKRRCGLASCWGLRGGGWTMEGWKEGRRARQHRECVHVLCGQHGLGVGAVSGLRRG